MALLADRVKETTTTTGTGTVSLAGAPAGFQSFNTAFANGSLVYYVIQGGAEWEIGIGTTGTGTLARTQVLQSSNADALVPFSAGVKDVFCSYVADRAVTTVDSATLTNKTIDDYTNNVGANSTHFRIKATGTISKGSVVKATGYNPGEMAIEVAVVSSATDLVLGISEQALTAGQFGLAVVIGELFDVNTNGFTVGNIIYSNGAGGFTETKPTSGLYQALGWIVRANASNGVIAVNVVAPLYVETATNTANTSVLRDGSGNFAAGTITATLSGTATQVSNALTAGTYLTSGGTYNGSAARTFAVDATDANTASKVVARDASGNFSAGTITATLNGAAPAGSLSGTTLAANVVTSSLTSVGTLTSGAIGAGFTAISDSALATISTAGKVSNSATTATSANTASAIVARDGSGNFSAGTITATLNGAAPAGSLSGTTLASGVTASSLTSVGTLSSLTVAAKVSANSAGTAVSGFSDYLNGGAWDILGASTAGSASTLAIGGYRSSQWIGINFYTSGVSRALIDNTGNLAVDTNTLYVDAANNRVGVGTASPVSAFHSLGTVTLGNDGFTDGRINAADSLLFYIDSNNDDGNDFNYFAWGKDSATAAGVELMRLNASGNLGLGVTPSAWAGSLVGALQLAGKASLASHASANAMYLSENAFWNGSGWRYIATDYATQYQQYQGQHQWFTAPSGTAGNAISFTQAMTLDASGNLGVGTTATAGVRLHQFNASGSIAEHRIECGGTDGVFSRWKSSAGDIGYYGQANVFIGGASSSNLGIASATGAITFGTGSTITERARIDASGNFGLGVTPSAWYAGAKAFQFGGNAALLNNASNASYFLHNAFYDTAWRYITSGQQAGAYSQINGTHQWSTAPSGTAGNAITFTQAMTLDASGNLGVGATSSLSGITLERSGGTSAEIKLNQTGTGGRDYRIASTGSGYGSAGNLIFYDATAAAERARITSGGYFKASDAGTYYGSTGTYHEAVQSSASSPSLIVYVTSATYQGNALFLEANRNTTDGTFYYISAYNAGSGTYRFRVADSGNVTNTNGTYGTISDAKYKTDIVDAGSQWADMKAIRFRKFKMKDDTSGLMQLGVVAQELEHVSPGLVEEHVDRDKDGTDLGTTTKSVKTSILLMKAAVALQEAMARIETLEQRVLALEA